MSAAVHPAAAGDRVKARLSTPTRTREETITLPDGSIVITREDLAVFGDGDPVRGAREIRLMIANEKEREVVESHSPRPANVRIAGPSDEGRILELLLIDVNENAVQVAPADPERILSHIRTATQKKGGICGVIDGPDRIEGVVLLTSAQWWWSRSFYFQEMSLFVHPDYRKSTHMRSLIAFQKWWVAEMTRVFGYQVHLLCGVLGIHRIRAKTMLYRRIFRQCGSVFLFPWPFKGTPS